MGIYDRDYIRHREPERPAFGRGLLSAVRMWSVTTWLIIACVAVFVVDGLVPRRPGVFTPVAISFDVPPSADRAAGAYVEQVGGTQFMQVPPGMPIEIALAYPELAALGRAPADQDNTGRIKEYLTRDVFDVSPREGPELVGTITYQWMPPLRHWLYFSTDLAVRKVEVWRLIGFQFLHASQWHLLFNMVALFFFGPLVERYLGPKRYLAFYLLCGICGALMYLVLNLGGYVVSLYTHRPVAIPWLLFNSPLQPLVGASAGVFGVLMAGAYLQPSATVYLFFMIPMRLATLAYALVVLALITVALGGANAGGEAGHLGGAAAGFYFIRHAHHLHGFFDFLGWVDPTSHHYRRGGSAGRDAEVDRILSKVTDSGVGSLTEREKRILRDAAERK